MGKQIKSTALTLDGSSMGAAPVSPGGTVRLRPKTDASALEVSYNGAAYVTLSGGGGGGTPRLDEVLDPTLNSTFGMTVYNLEFTYTGSTGVNDFIIQSAPSASGAGALLFVRTQATTSTKSPLRVEANDVYAFGVLANGSTLIGNHAAQTLTNTSTSSTLSYFDQNLTVSPASASTAEHRLLDQGVTFGTAQNTTTLRLRYAAIDHNVAATLTSFYVDNVTFTQSAGTTSTANGYAATFNIQAGTTSQVLGSATNINAAGGTISSSIGFYSLVDQSSGTFTSHIGFKLFASGTIGTLYGCIMPSGSLSGFGIDPPTATLHASGSVRFDLGSDARGDVFYRSSSGPISRLAIGTSTQVLTVTDIGGGILEPRWATPAGGGGSGNPGGSASELQYRAGSTAFGAVSNSAVSGANITLGGTFTMDAAGVQDQSIAASALTASDTKITFTEYKGAATPILLQFDRARGTSSSPTNLSSADIIGELKFRGRVSAAFAQQAYIRAAWDSSDGGTLQMGVGATSGSGTRFVATVNSGLGLFDTGGNAFTVSGSGFTFSHGTTGSLYYRDAFGLFTALTIGGSTTFLKGGTIPSWASLAGSDITSGTVALARGGTGASLVDPNADRIFFWDDSAGTTDWLTVGTGLSITGTTLTATGGAGGSPGGSASEIQYRSGASTFGAVSNSAVSGANVTLGGTLSLDAAGSQDQSMVLSALTASDTKITFTEYKGAATPISLQFDRSRGTSGVPTNLSTGDVIAQLQFRGRVSAAFAQLGYLRSLYSSTDGGTVELGAGATSGAGTRFIATANSGASITDTGGNFFAVSGSGFQFSHGSTGSIYYRDSVGLFTALTIGSSTTFLKGGTIPSWSAISASTDITTGTLPLARGGTGASLVDPNADRILFWDDSAGAVAFLTAGTGLTITGTTMTASGGTPAGSGGELQYNNSSAFGAVLSSSVDGSGIITFGSGQTIWKSDSSVLLSFRSYNSTAAQAPQLSFLRSRGSEGSKSAVLSGDTLFTMPISGEYDSAGAREAARITVDAMSNFSSTSASTVFRLKTTQENAIFPNERLVIGGTKQLTNATLTDLFTITFGTADQLGMGGEVHLLLVAKGLISGVVHTFIHRRVISFAIAHNANNDMMVNFTEVQQHRSGGASDDTGLTAISHALNSDGAVGTGTNIPSTPNAYATNAITYKILATAVPNMSSVSQLTCYYHIIYHGEASLTLS